MNLQIRYKAIAPAVDADGNLCYNEKTCGVQFQNGLAYFDDVTVKGIKLGRTAAEIADMLVKDFGYEVEKMNMDGSPYIEEPVEDEEKIKPVATRNKKKVTEPVA